MDSCEFHINFLELTNGEVVKIKGTDSNDSIVLECFDKPDRCTLTINDNSHAFQKGDLKNFEMVINAGKGNDNINVTVPKGMHFTRIQIYPGEGTNKIYTKLFYPYSSATINLDYGSNTISFDPLGTDVFIKGFKNSPNNKIQIRDPNLTLDDIIMTEYDTKPRTYGVYLKSPDNPVDKRYLCDIFNSLSPAEYDAYATLKVLIDAGMPIPSQYQSMSYVLDGPKDLANEVLNSHNFIFSIE